MSKHSSQNMDRNSDRWYNIEEAVKSRKEVVD